MRLRLRSIHLTNDNAHNTHVAESFGQIINGLPVLSLVLTASLDGFVSSTFESGQF